MHYDGAAVLIRFVPGTGACSFLPDTEEVLVPVSPGENFKSILRRTNRFCADNDLDFVFVVSSDEVEQCTASNADEALLAVQKLQRDIASMDGQKLEYEEARESGVMAPQAYYEWLRRFRTARDAKLNELALAQYKHDMLKCIESDDLILHKRKNATLLNQIKDLEDNRERLLKRLAAAQEEVDAERTKYNERMEKVFEAYGSRDIGGIVRLIENLGTKRQVQTARRGIVEWRVIAVFMRFINSLGIELSMFPKEVQAAVHAAKNLVRIEQYAGYAPIITPDMEIDTSTFDTYMALVKAKEKE